MFCLGAEYMKIRRTSFNVLSIHMAKNIGDESKPKTTPTELS